MHHGGIGIGSTAGGIGIGIAAGGVHAHLHQSVGGEVGGSSGCDILVAHMGERSIPFLHAVRVAAQVPGHAQHIGHALHGGKPAQTPREHLAAGAAARFIEIGLRQGGHEFEHGVAQGIAPVAVHIELQHQSALARAVGHGHDGYIVREPQLIVELFVQPRRAAIAQNGAEHGNGCGIRVVGGRGAPGQHEGAGGLRKLAAVGARPPLPGLGGGCGRLGRAGRHAAELCFHGIEKLLRIHIARHAQEHVAWHIAVVVVVHHVLVAQGIEATAGADDGLAARGHLEQRADERVVGGVLRVVVVHAHFAADDIALAFPFIAGESGVQGELAEQVQELAPVGGGAVDVEHGAVGAGVGVPHAAQLGHALVELAGVELICAFEYHVLQQV